MIKITIKTAEDMFWGLVKNTIINTWTGFLILMFFGILFILPIWGLAQFFFWLNADGGDVFSAYFYSCFFVGFAYFAGLYARAFR